MICQDRSIDNSLLSSHKNFSPIGQKMRQNRNSKIEAYSLLPNLVEKPNSKFQAKILINVGCETFLVTTIG